MLFLSYFISDEKNIAKSKIEIVEKGIPIEGFSSEDKEIIDSTGESIKTQDTCNSITQDESKKKIW